MIIYSNDTGAKLLKLIFSPKQETKEKLLAEIQCLSFTKEFGRNTAWLGEEGLNYPYTGRDHIAQGWTMHTKMLTDYINTKYFGSSDFTCYFNHLLVNQYLPGQRLSHHKDDEPELRGPIASLSFGDTATFDFTAGSIEIKDGDFLIGNRKFFDQLKHGVSSTHNNGIRYNLTWRRVINNQSERIY